jgi:hypothetical protein
LRDPPRQAAPMGPQWRASRAGDTPRR